MLSAMILILSTARQNISPKDIKMKPVKNASNPSQKP
jgi:hypothetical protein